MTAYAFGGLRWRDGMLLCDYLDAVDFREAGRPVPRAEWVERFRAEAAIRSLEGFI